MRQLWPGTFLGWFRLVARRTLSLAASVQIEGARIRLDDAGSGLPLLLLHGFPATRRLWSGVTPHLLTAGFRVIVPDLIGYGESDAPPDARIDMASQANWMLRLLDHLEVGRVALVAHDVGTAAAQLMAVSAPHRIRGIALLDGVYEADWAMEAISSIQAWDPTDAHRLFPVLKRRLGKSEALREMLEVYEGQSGGLRLIRASKDLDPLQTKGLGERLRTAGVPAAVLWGERDEYLSIERVGQLLAESLRTRLVRLPGGHFTPLDCPIEVSGALCRFLATIPRDG